MVDRRGPAVVALGGGHGLSLALRAIRQYAGSVTAIVSVADDGGSSGRLRRDLGMPAPGDARRCLVALAGAQSAWAEAFEHRFASGELDGHALGNLVLAGLAEVLGSFEAALDEAGRVLEAVGRVLPATAEPVALKAVVVPPPAAGADSRAAARGGDGAGGSAPVHGQLVEGQVAVSGSRGIRRVTLAPPAPAAPPAAVAAIGGADQVVLAPGSLYTSLLPVLCVPALAEALRTTSAGVVQVANLAPEAPETADLDGTAHLRAVLDHGGRVDLFVYEADGPLAVDASAVAAWGVQGVPAATAGDERGVHDPDRLAKVLSALL